MNGINEYTAYFKNIAVQHTAIAHKDVSGEKAFFRGEINEIIDGFRSGTKHQGVMLRLLLPEWKLQQLNPGATTKESDCGFFILKFHKHDDFDEHQAAMDTTEEIAEEIIARMRKDNMDDTSLLYNTLQTSKITVDPITKIGDNYSGWWVTFQLSNSYNKCIDNNNWKDL